MLCCVHLYIFGQNNLIQIKTLDFMQPGLHSKVYEYTPCSYTLSVQSLYGCPQECPEINGQLCSGHGLCSFDATNNKSRCYCYHSYEGNDCSLPSSSDNTNIEKSTKPKPNNTQFVHTFDANNVNITYDLSPFALDNHASYTILDKFNNATDDKTKTNFIYFVGILQPIAPPVECQNINVSGDQIFAYQLDNKTKQCYALGTSAHWHLYDEIDDAARGVTITYSNGSVCETMPDRKRQFSLSLVCPDDQKVFDAEMERTISAFVEEVDTCQYSMQIYSAFACPYQCLTEVNDQNEFDVCSNHGMCASDPFAGYVRCLCDDNWDGAACQNPPTPAPTLSPSQFPSVSPSKYPSNGPTKSPTVSPTKTPSDDPSVSPTKRPTESPSEPVVVTKVEKVAVKGNDNAYIYSIVGLCVGILAAIFIGWMCYKRMKNKHEEFKEYAQFRDQSLSRNLAGSVGFAIGNGVRRSNVGDEYDDDKDDQLL